MGQSGGLGRGLPDEAGGRGGPGGGLSGRLLPFLVGLEDCAGGGVDFVVEFEFSGMKLDFVDLYAVFMIQLAFIVEDIPLGHARVGQSGGLGRGFPDKTAGGLRSAGGAGLAGGGSAGIFSGVLRQLYGVKQLRFRLPHAPGGGVDLIFIFQISGAEMNIIHLNAVFQIRLAGVAGDIAFRYPGVSKGDGLGRFRISGLRLGRLCRRSV